MNNDEQKIDSLIKIAKSLSENTNITMVEALEIAKKIL